MAQVTVDPSGYACGNALPVRSDITLYQRMRGCEKLQSEPALHAWCRFLQTPRTRAQETRWWAWAPHISLQGGQVMAQEVCEGGAYIDKFIVSTGTATVDANSTRAFRARGILSVQGRCSDGKQLGYYGPLPSDTSVAYEQENIGVSTAAQDCLHMSCLDDMCPLGGACAVRHRQQISLSSSPMQHASLNLLASLPCADIRAMSDEPKHVPALAQQAEQGLARLEECGTDKCCMTMAPGDAAGRLHCAKWDGDGFPGGAPERGERGRKCDKLLAHPMPCRFACGRVPGGQGEPNLPDPAALLV